MQSRPQISYKLLRKINPETARTAVLEYLKSGKGNVTETARVFGIQRLTVYNIINRQTQGGLKDRSKAPKRVANKTPAEIEKKILKVRSRTGFGPKRLQKFLYDHYGLNVAYGTIRGIVGRAVCKHKYLPYFRRS